MESISDKDLVSFARYAEQAERYEDMVKYMKEVTTRKKDLIDEERNLLSVAYKNVVGAKRAARRILVSIESKEKGSKPYLVDYINNVVKEIKEICTDVIGLIDDYLLKSCSGEQEDEQVIKAQVFYLKMKGDYYRYIVEVLTPDSEEHNSNSDFSEKAYSNATERASGLEATNPIKLGLALNLSVFYYEIKNDTNKACELAKKAFDEAMATLDNLPEDSYKDSTMIMQLLRDNLTLWSKDENDES